MKSHEHSNPHLNAIQSWMDLKMSISKNSIIDKTYQMAIEKEKQHWKDVMIRIIAAIHYLGKHNDALRGSSDFLNSKHSGL